jgi:ABC-type phosphate transport system permease subunit
MDALKVISMVFIILMVAGIVVVVSIESMSTFQDSMPDNTTLEWNATNSTKNTLSNTSELFTPVAWLGIAVMFVLLAIVCWHISR